VCSGEGHRWRNYQVWSMKTLKFRGWNSY
jgi:hypothetical protein